MSFWTDFRDTFTGPFTGNWNGGLWGDLFGGDDKEPDGPTQALRYADTLYPGTTPYERLSFGGGGAAQAGSGDAQSARQIKAQERMNKLNNMTQLATAGMNLSGFLGANKYKTDVQFGNLPGPMQDNILADTANKQMTARALAGKGKGKFDKGVDWYLNTWEELGPEGPKSFEGPEALEKALKYESDYSGYSVEEIKNDPDCYISIRESVGLERLGN